MHGPSVDLDDHPTALHEEDNLVLHDELLPPVVHRELARGFGSPRSRLRVPPFAHGTSKAPQGLGALSLVLRHRPPDPHDLVVAHRLRHELLPLDPAHEPQDVVYVFKIREADLAFLPRINVVGGGATGIDDLEDTVLRDHLSLGLLPASEDDPARIFSRRNMNRLPTWRSSSRGRSLRSFFGILASFEAILHPHHPDVEVHLDGLDLLAHVRVANVNLLANVHELLTDLVLEGVQGLSLGSLSPEELSEHVLHIRFLGLSLRGAVCTSRGCPSLSWRPRCGGFHFCRSWSR